ncbi:MAG: DUF2185 domain-containing protein [Flavipsychrobacter sp.]|nr:DUF2185 domain-containing protein [Flavipsychrobacter sp.]
MEKQYKIINREILDLIAPIGGCITTDKITVDGMPVNYMYRGLPYNDTDSGWRFFSGTEDQDYLNDLTHSAVYDVNTIANYDQSIIPYLYSPTGTILERNKQGTFDIVAQ